MSKTNHFYLQFNCSCLNIRFSFSVVCDVEIYLYSVFHCYSPSAWAHVRHGQRIHLLFATPTQKANIMLHVTTSFFTQIPFFFASFLRMMKCAQHRGKPKYTFADNNNINRKKNPRSAAQRQFISLGLRRIQPERLLLQPMYPQPHRYRCYWRPVRRVLFSFFSSVCLCIVWRVKIVTGYNTEKKTRKSYNVLKLHQWQQKKNEHKQEASTGLKNGLFDDTLHCSLGDVCFVCCVPFSLLVKCNQDGDQKKKQFLTIIIVVVIIVSINALAFVCLGASVFFAQ